MWLSGHYLVSPYSLSRFRQNFSLIIPKPGDLYATLDACKVVDSTIFVITPPAGSGTSTYEKTTEETLGFDEIGEELLAAITAQGLPTPTFIVTDIETIPVKKRGDYKKALHKLIDRFVPIEKLHVIEKESDALRLFHHIGSQKQRRVFQRDLRSHLFCEESKFTPNASDPTLGTLVVDGFIRYQPLNVNGLVHIPGWGDFQLEKIEVRRGPGEFFLLEEANPSLQESLKSENEPDPLNGEQTWPYQEEMDGQPVDSANGEKSDAENKKALPKGTSEYQAAWIREHEPIDEESDDEEDDDDDDDIDDGDGDCQDMLEESDEADNAADDASEMEGMESEDMPENLDAQQYDKKVGFADEEDYCNRIKGVV